MPKSEPEEAQKYDRLKRLGDALEAACKYFEAQLRAPAGREALAYLTRRGLNDRTIAEFRLGYAPPASDALRAALMGQGHDEAVLEEVGLIRRPDDGRAPYGFFRNRAIFPVADKRGRIIAFGGRILEGEGPKYVNSPEHALFHKGTVLYGLARARTAIAKGERPVVVEGYMDVIALQAAGIGGAVAPLGTALAEGQLAELWKAQDPKVQRDHPPILCFDGDGAGRRENRCKPARNGIGHRHVGVLEGLYEREYIERVHEPRCDQPVPRLVGQGDHQRDRRDQQRAEPVDQRPARHLVLAGLEDRVDHGVGQPGSDHQRRSSDVQGGSSGADQRQPRRYNSAQVGLAIRRQTSNWLFAGSATSAVSCSPTRAPRTCRSSMSRRPLAGSRALSS